MRKETDVFDDIEGLILAEARKYYSEKVIEHFMNPKNLETMEDPDCFTAMSGICGDTIGIYVDLDNNTIRRATFVTDGCGPTIACGSALTSMAQGLSIEQAQALTSQDLIDYLGGLPVEHTHCADLAVNTLRGAVEKARKSS